MAMTRSVGSGPKDVLDRIMLGIAFFKIEFPLTRLLFIDITHFSLDRYHSYSPEMKTIKPNTVKSIPIALLKQQSCSCLLYGHPCLRDRKACC